MNNKGLHTFTDLIKENKIFFILYSVFLVYGAVRMIIIPKGAEVLWLNNHYTPLLDIWFKIWSIVGDGLFFAVLLIPILLIKIRYSLLGLLSLIGSGLSAQVMKRMIDSPRPKAFFTNHILNTIPGVKLYTAHSFPSGHTTTAFALFLMLALISKNKNWGLFYFLCAAFVGMSRVYLAQHFFCDVYAGSIIGVLFTMLFYMMIEHLHFFRKRSWHDKNIRQFSFFKKS